MKDITQQHTSNERILCRMGFIFFLVLLGFIYVARVMYHVQISRHDELLAKARKTYTSSIPVPGERGEIYDYNGNLLAANKPMLRIICDPSLLDGNEQIVVDYIADHFGDIDKKAMLEDLQRKEIIGKKEDGSTKITQRRYTVLVKGIDYIAGKEFIREVREKCTEYEKLEKKARREKNKEERAEYANLKTAYQSIGYKVISGRYYPKGSLFSNMLGYVDTNDDEFEAKCGIEYFMDGELVEEDGFTSYERTVAGTPLNTENRKYVPALDGANVYLTVREPLQAIVEEEIDALMERTDPKMAMVVMIDPYTGDIMAAAQRPTYNPNKRAELKKEDASKITNWLAFFTFEPGSIMKSITMAYALDRGFVKPDTLVDCEQRAWRYAGFTLHDTHTVGIVPAGEIIKQSSNIGTAKIAVDMGKENLYNAMEMFGFGQKTGIQLGYESKGRLLKLDKWGKIHVARICFGQGITVTPLQMARAYCMLANGGHKINLRLIDRVQRDNEVTKWPVVYEEKSSFVNPNTQKYITDMMRSVTEPGGTGKAAAVPGYYVAGKTGTGQKAENGHYSSSKYYSSFCGYVPAYKPQFVLLVVTDEPHKGSNLNGGPISGPTFKAISERSLRYLGVANDLPEEMWLAERAELQKIQTAKIRAEDARVAAQRQKNAEATVSNYNAKSANSVKR